MGTFWARSNSVEFDLNGDRAGGAKAYFYDGGTTTPRTTYQDASLTTPHAHPVVADANGRWPAIYLQFGDYKSVATTSAGVQLWSADNIPNDEPTDPATSVDATALLTTGETFFRFKDGTRDGAVRANGRTIGSAASGATERANADTEELFTELWNSLANGQAAVSGGRGATAAADFAAHKTLTLPDLRGSVPLGLDTMGNSAASRLTGTTFTSGNSSTAGSVCGANTHTLASTEFPTHTHVFAATSASAGDHNHTYSGTVSAAGSHEHAGTVDSSGAHTHTVTQILNRTDLTAGGLAGGHNTGGGSAGGVSTDSSGAHVHTFTTDTEADHQHTYSGTSSTNGAHAHDVSGTTSPTGDGGAHNNVSRAILGTWYIKL